jgi:hypothetical protein
LVGARRCCRRAPLSIRRPVSRVLYGAARKRTARDGHSSGTPVARRLRQPTRTAGSRHRSRSNHLRNCSAPSLFGFAPGGVCHAVSVAGNAVRSYRTFSPLPRQYSTHRGGLLLCGTFPGVAPAGRYPAPYVHGARTFLSGHLSVIAGAAVQPTDGNRDGMARGARQGMALLRVSDRFEAESEFFPQHRFHRVPRIVGFGANNRHARRKFVSRNPQSKRRRQCPR